MSWYAPIGRSHRDGLQMYVLVPNRRQTISKHHADLIVTSVTDGSYNVT